MKKNNQRPEETAKPEASKCSIAVVCDPFFIKTDIHGYCIKCGKNLGYVRK